MRMNKKNPSKLTALTAAVLTVAACGGGGGGGGGNGNGGGGGGGSGSSTTACTASIDTGGTGGLSGGADYQGLHYYLNEDQLCGLDPSSGVSFLVDSGVGGPHPVPVLTGTPAHVPTDDTSGLVDGRGVHGVVYVTDEGLRYARTEGGSDAPPSPEEVANLTGDADVGAIRVAIDYANPSDTAVAYARLEDEDGSITATWHQTTLDGGSIIDFDADHVPVTSISNFEAGSPEGWIVHDQASSEAIVVDFDGNTVGDPLELEGEDAPATITHLSHVTDFDDGESLLSASNDGSEFRFLLHDPAAGQLSKLGEDPNGNPLGRDLLALETSDGEAFYYLDGEGPVTLHKVDANGSTQLETAGPDPSQGAFLVATDDRLVWGWNDGSSVDEITESEVRAAAKDGSSLESLYSGAGALSTVVRGSASGWVFFTEAELSGTSLTSDAHAVMADDGGQQKTFPDAAWQGASHPEDAAYEAELATQPVEHVFLVEGTNDELFVVDAATPGDADSKVSLGALEQDNLLGPSVMMSNFGLGPHRLMKSVNDLVYADVRAADSAQTVMAADSGDILTVDGF